MQSWQDKALDGADRAISQIVGPSWMLAARVQEEILAQAISAANEFKLRVLATIEAERLQAIEVASAPGVAEHHALQAQSRMALCKRIWNEVAIMPALEKVP